VEAVKFLWKQKHFEERGWKRKQTRKHLIFSFFHKKQKHFSQNMGQGCGNESTLKKLETEANSEATNFI